MIKIHYTVKPFDQLSVYELYDIMRLRQEIFVVEQNCPYIDADYVDLKALHVQGRNDDGQLMTHTRLMDKGVVYDNYSSIGRVVNSAVVRGKGAGKELMRFSIDTIRRYYPSPIKIGAQSYLQKFYESFGFEFTGEHYLEDGIPHMKMILE
jgi:ElaA protein